MKNFTKLFVITLFSTLAMSGSSFADVACGAVASGEKDATSSVNGTTSPATGNAGSANGTTTPAAPTTP